MSSTTNRGGGLASGWILVSGLLLLCIVGTGLTWWNYSRQVFSSAHGIVCNTGGESLVVVKDLPARDTALICPGHQARMTVASDRQVIKGAVVSVDRDTCAVLIRLLNEPGQQIPKLPEGMLCSVTIDTTVPPMERSR